MLQFTSYLSSINIRYWIPVLFILWILFFLYNSQQYGVSIFRIIIKTNKSLDTTRISTEISAKTSTTSTSLTTQLTKMLVVAHYKERIEWLDLFIGGRIPHIVYTRSRESLIVHKIVDNKGREAAVYLQYIIEHYSTLPSSIAFIQADRKPWHQQRPADIVIALRALRWNKYPYMPLTGSLTEAEFLPNNNRPQYTINSKVWRDILQDELGPPPPNGTKSHCCATFVVRRENILAHNKTFYSRLLNYIKSSPDSDQSTGRTLEFTWHLIFGQPAHLTFSKCDLFVCDSKENIDIRLAETDI